MPSFPDLGSEYQFVTLWGSIWVLAIFLLVLVVSRLFANDDVISKSANEKVLRSLWRLDQHLENIVRVSELTLPDSAMANPGRYTRDVPWFEALNNVMEEVGKPLRNLSWCRRLLLALKLEVAFLAILLIIWAVISISFPGELNETLVLGCMFGFPAGIIVITFAALGWLWYRLVR